MTETLLLTIIRIIGYMLVVLILWWAYKIYKYVQHATIQKAIDMSGEMPTNVLQTERLNPGLFSKNAMPPSAQDLPNQPFCHLPLNILPQHTSTFTGMTIANLISTFGLVRCDNGTYALMREQGKVLFTMLNLQKPGTFPDTLESLENIKGIMLVLELPNGKDCCEDYETFYAIANEMSITCNGRLCTHDNHAMNDKNRNLYRNAVQEFQQEYNEWLAQYQ